MSCDDGQCAFRQCLDKFGDFDAIGENGCEADFDALHIESANPDGSNIVCVNGYDNLDGKKENGCEKKIENDNPKKCGLRQTDCTDTLKNTTAQHCIDGVCHFDRCKPKFGDFDAIGENGCEADFDALHIESANPDGSNIVCADGYEDADNNILNGCETKGESAKSCGKKQLDCTLTIENAESIRCVAGECVFVRCKTGYGDCNNEKNDGCETHTDTHPSHCGVCGINCVERIKNIVTETWTCSSGKCDFGGTCKERFGNFNNDRSDGCEVDFDANHIKSADVNGDNMICQTFYRDLDGNKSNGCESHEKTDKYHCGKKNIDCEIAVRHASGFYCNEGICDYSHCRDGYENRDNDRSNGCEIIDEP